MRIHFSILIAASLLTLSLPAPANKLDVPIMEEGNEGVDLPTCSGSIVVGLDPNGDGFLAVRSGPGSKYHQLAELHNGDRVAVFDQNGNWAGVVYGELLPGECVSTKDRPVQNPKKGWVHSKWLRHEAG